MDRYRSEHNEIPTRAQLAAFLAENGLAMTAEEDREFAEDWLGEEGEDADAADLARLRAGKAIDRYGRPIVVPRDRNALATLSCPMRRAAFIGRTCNRREELTSGLRRKFWEGLSSDLTASLRRQGVDERRVRALMIDLSIEVTAEVDRREASLAKHLREIST